MKRLVDHLSEMMHFDCVGNECHKLKPYKTMNKNTIDSLVKAILSASKGTDRMIIQERPAYTLKKYQVNLWKRSTFWGRFVGYEKQKTVQVARLNGRTYQPNHWESYQRFCEGFFKDHKGKFKVCLGHAAFKHEHKHAEWLLDGKPVSYESVEHMLKSDDKRKEKPAFDWITPNAENIVQIDNHIIKPSVAKV